MNTHHTAVVTGIGLVTPLGNTKEKLLENLTKGRAAPLSEVPFDFPHYPSMKVFKIQESYFSEKECFLDPFIRYGLSAAKEAVTDARLDLSQCDLRRVGVVVSSSKGGVATFAEAVSAYRQKSSAFNKNSFYETFSPASLSRIITERFQLRGPVKNIATACATGTHSIIEGVRMIEDGEVDFCLAGAADASIDPLMLSGYQQMGVYASDGIYPYDIRRDGFVIGEGAGVVLLERKESAQARGVKQYGEIDGYVSGQETNNVLMFDAEDDILARLFKLLVERLDDDTIDYLNTHGTATRAGDVYETQQIKKAFGSRAYDISLSSTKSFMGHLLGAAGAVECIICLLSMQHNFVPPTINYQKKDPVCDLDYTPNTMKEKHIGRAVSLSMGFGGQIGIVSMKK
ncbi:MAG: beta-ketoacyl-[acyl-carrier-protein] synthase family protein [Candidatus Omnitrophica bacterium]|nr:beta-ketoacyl-[acyl-carrier-protein] synthase family protein [Candidatus Omnitrophota bacterium]